MLGAIGAEVPVVDGAGVDPLAGASGFLPPNRPPLKREPPLGVVDVPDEAPTSADLDGAAKKLDVVDPA